MSTPAMSTSWVTVIIPTYGRQDMVERAVASVARARKGRSVEVVVVDDGSPEPIRLPREPRSKLVLNPAEDAAEDAADDPSVGAAWVRIVRLATNQGPGAARNAGIDAARGEYVSFLDSDDMYTEDRFDRVADAIAERPGHDLYLCWARFEDEPVALEGRVLEGNVHDVILEQTAPCLDTITVRREAALHFDPQYRACQDLEWWLRMSEGHTVHTIRAVGCVLGRHDGPRHGNGKLARIEYSKRLLQEHGLYFARHTKARAFRLYRMSRLALQTKRFGDARRFAWDAALSDRAFVPRSASVWLRSWVRPFGAA